MNIAFLSTYDFAIPGGVKNHVCHLAQELTHQGHHVSIIAPSSQSLITHQIPNFMEVTAFPSVKTGYIPPHILLSPKAILKLKHLLETHSFDLVHIHEPLIPPLCLSALFHKKTPLFATFHTYYEKGQPLYRAFRPLLNALLSQLRGRIAVSTPAKKYIEQYFPYDYKIIPNGIDLPRFSEKMPQASCIRPGYIHLLFIGHAQFKRKGLRYMLEAYHLLKKEYPRLRLIIAGTKWVGTSAPTELNHMNTEDIIYLGTVSDEELIGLYQSADIFCAPSIGNESFGIVLIEAMASGIPIIATHIEGYRSVVKHNQDALLVPPKNSEALSKAIQQLIDNPALGQRLTAQAKINVQRYAWSHLAREVMSYYDDRLSRAN